MKFPKTWYVIADGGRARILQERDSQAGFEIRQEFVSTDIHRHTRELGMERPGRTHESATSAHHEVEPREDLHRAAKRNFVHDVAKAINEANAGGEFDRLILVAPAHALGQFHEALDAPARQKIVAELQKDLTNVRTGEIAKHLSNVDAA